MFNLQRPCYFIFDMQFEEYVYLPFYNCYMEIHLIQQKVTMLYENTITSIVPNINICWILACKNKKLLHPTKIQL